MATENITLVGKSVWVNLHKADKNPFSGIYNYKAHIEVDDENLRKFHKSGIRTKVRDGNIVSLNRPQDGKEMPDGTIIGGGRPIVLDKDDTEWDMDKFIGRGSLLELGVSVYDTRMGKGHRLDYVKVLDYVPGVEKDETKEETPKKSNKKVPF